MKNIRYFAIALALGFASLFSHQDAHAQPFGLITVKDASGVKIDETHQDNGR